MKSLCATCKRATNHKSLKEHVVDIQEYDTGWWAEHKYQIIQCQGCDSMSFRKLYTDTGQSQMADEMGEDPWSQELYPNRSMQSLSIRNLMNTPLNVKQIYRETIDAFNNGQNILCSGGLRAIIEGVCKERGIDRGEVSDGKGGKRISKGLDGKIEGLASKRFLSEGNAEVLHELRFLGNEALHELSSPSADELKMAIDIIDHTLDNIYELHLKASKLKAETAKRKT